MIECFASQQSVVEREHSLVLSAHEVVRDAFVNKFRVLRGHWLLVRPSHCFGRVDAWHWRAVHCRPRLGRPVEHIVLCLVVDVHFVQNYLRIVTSVTFFEPLGLITGPRVRKVAEVLKDGFVTVHQFLLHDPLKFN